MDDAAATALPCVGRYRLGPVIGRGGMGVVHRGYDPLLERTVAIKIIDRGPGDPMLSEALRREARVVAQLDHPGIVSVHDLVEDSRGRLHVVMPLVEGSTLRTLLRERPLSVAATIAVAARIADALRYSHARGVVHRDIKPENVMIVEHDRHIVRLKLMDFGLAVPTGALQPDAKGRVYGTAGYLSPEQALGLPVDGRSDVYALGVVVFECCTGSLPFERASDDARIAALVEDAPLLSSRVPEVPEALDALVAACLHRDPARRPRSTDDVCTVLRSLADGSTDPLDLDLDVDPGPGSLDPQGMGADSRPTIAVSSRPSANTVAGSPDMRGSLGAVLLVHGEYEAAERAFVAERATRSMSANIAERIEHQGWRVNLAHKLGRYEDAIERCDGLLGQLDAEEIEDPATEATMHAWAAIVASAAGWLPVARERVDAAARSATLVAEGAEQARVMTLVLRARGNLYMAEGRTESALEAMVEGLRHAEEHEDAWERSIARFNLGEALVAVGRSGAALSHLQRAAEEKLVIGDRWGLAYLHRTRALVHLERGELLRAEDELRIGAALSEAIGDPKLIAMHHIDRGTLALERGRDDQAMQWATSALDVARRRGGRAEECAALVLMARLRRAVGRSDEALAFARAALELAGPSELGMARADALIEQALARSLEGERELAEAGFDEASELVVAWGNPLRRLDLDVTRLEQGAVVDGADGLEAQALDCLERAGRWGARLVEARILAVLVWAAQLRGELERARSRALTAVEAFERCGARGRVQQLQPLMPAVRERETWDTAVGDAP